jgi:hypothetical protein
MALQRRDSVLEQKRKKRENAQTTFRPMPVDRLHQKENQKTLEEGAVGARLSHRDNAPIEISRTYSIGSVIGWTGYVLPNRLEAVYKAQHRIQIRCFHWFI